MPVTDNDTKLICMKWRAKKKLSLMLLLLPGGLVACTAATSDVHHSANSDVHQPAEVCSTLRHNFIESKVATGDGQGHGPDTGSFEWHSVVEFKLGVRGDAQVPERGSSQWCEFVEAKLK